MIHDSHEISSEKGRKEKSPKVDSRKLSALRSNAQIEAGIN